MLIPSLPFSWQEEPGLSVTAQAPPAGAQGNDPSQHQLGKLEKLLFLRIRCPLNGICPSRLHPCLLPKVTREASRKILFSYNFIINANKMKHTLIYSTNIC